METLQFNDLQYSEIDVNDQVSTTVCYLEEDDIQCGQVLYNDVTRILKFFCTFCGEIYDSINYFSQHLSEHIAANDLDIKHEAAFTNSLLDSYDPAEDQLVDEVFKHEQEIQTDINKDAIEILLPHEQPQQQQQQQQQNDHSNGVFIVRDNHLNNVRRKTSDDINDVQHNSMDYTECNGQLENLSSDSIRYTQLDNDILIEEVDELQEIQADAEEVEIPKTIDIDNDANNSMFVSVTNTNATIPPLTVTTIKSESVNNQPPITSFEECFLKEMNIEKLRNERVCVLQENDKTQRKPNQRRKKTSIQELLRLKGKRKRVTTVKVIAVKNRIAELYERIKIEEQRRSQAMLDENNKLPPLETDTASADQDNISSDICQTDSQECSNNEVVNNEITRKIIGETLITLIPEGSKIPNTLPATADKIAKATTVNDESNECQNPPNTQVYQGYGSMVENTVCPACGKRFRSSFSLTIHKRIHYLESDSAVKLAHKCPDCDQLFNKISQLKEHVESVHYPDGFICKICNRKLSSLSLLERHMRKVHLDRPFNCKQCGKNFANRLTYDEHLMSHMSGKVYKCHTCGRKYPTEYFLTEHMRNHKEQIPQTCVVCGKVTLRITQHMKIHTPRPKRLLTCSVCGKVFNFSSGLSHHFKMMHKLPRPPSKTKKQLTNTTAEKTRRDSRCSANLQTDNTSTPQPLQNPLNPSNDATNLDEFPQAANQNENQTQIPTPQQEDFDCKEEEAKRVIVELIQNSKYTFVSDSQATMFEITPPIAREETITAVNSIVNDC